MTKSTDLAFTNFQSFVCCTPVTAEGKAWCEEHIPDYEGTAFMIDWRCLGDIVTGARADGLVCNDASEVTWPNAILAGHTCTEWALTAHAETCVLCGATRNEYAEHATATRH